MTPQTARSEAAQIAAAVQEIDRGLPEMARLVIRQHLDLNDASNRAFLEQPDGRGHHQAQWHQWGIITHTRRFLEHFDRDIPSYLRAWGLWERVRVLLAGPIDGTPRWDLLRVSILLHDIGKFGARTQGRSSFHFAGHERLSGEIIRTELDLAQFGLTPDQIAYVARTAEDHFVLAFTRKRAREIAGYDPDFVGSESFVEQAREILYEHSDDYVEVGVLFLGDSLAKLAPPEGPERALGQYEINIAVARRYLEIVLREGPEC